MRGKKSDLSNADRSAISFGQIVFDIFSFYYVNKGKESAILDAVHDLLFT